MPACCAPVPAAAASSWLTGCRLAAIVSSPCRPEMVVGWYHSHPGFGCWLSGVDVNTQQSFEALNQRAVAGERLVLRCARCLRSMHGCARVTPAAAPACGEERRQCSHMRHGLLPALLLAILALCLLRPAPACSGGGPHPVGEGQGGDRCIPLHQVGVDGSWLAGCVPRLPVSAAQLAMFHCCAS